MSTPKPRRDDPSDIPYRGGWPPGQVWDGRVVGIDRAVDLSSDAAARSNEHDQAVMMNLMDDIQVDHVTAAFPGSPRYVRAVRLLLTAAVSGMDVDQLDDLRIVVDELWSATLEISPGPVALALELAPGSVRVTASAPWSGDQVQLDPMRAAIVEALAAEYRFESDGSQVEFEFRFPPGADDR